MLPEHTHQPVRGQKFIFMLNWWLKNKAARCVKVCLLDLRSTLALWLQLRLLQDLKPLTAEEAHWEISASSAHAVLHTILPGEQAGKTLRPSLSLGCL